MKTEETPVAQEQARRGPAAIAGDPETRREALRKRYPPAEGGSGPAVGTGGVSHLALICSDLDATLRFYTEVVGLRVTRIVANRDEPTSTHVFLDMGGGNLLAFFDFPQKDPTPTVRGVGSMHHVALKATPKQYRALMARLREKDIPHQPYGGDEAGGVYLRDPDDILIEVTTAPR